MTATLAPALALAAQGFLANGAPVAVVVEVSTQLVPRDVAWTLEKLPRFFDFFHEYRDYELLGGVAGMVVKEDVLRCAEDHGLFVLGRGEGAARRLDRKGFVPKVWRDAGDSAQPA